MNIGLISCTKSKTPYAAPAMDLYSPSALFRGALEYLWKRADPIYVLSAKYGLMALNQVAEPYDFTLKHESPADRRRWAHQVFTQIQVRHGRDLDGITFEFHTGKEYRADLKRLLEAAGATCICPVEGLTIGERLSFYARGGAVAAALQSADAPDWPAALPRPGQPELPRPSRVTGKIHAEVWLAAAYLHETGKATFSPSSLVRQVAHLFGDIRAGVKTHVHAHCVATAPLNTIAVYNYLVRTESGELRLYRQGNRVHPSRTGGKTAPEQADVPEEWWPLWRRWRT